jgi:hypothetical protein
MFRQLVLSPIPMKTNWELRKRRLNNWWLAQTRPPASECCSEVGPAPEPAPKSESPDSDSLSEQSELCAEQMQAREEYLQMELREQRLLLGEAEE